jgi:WD40 repeat protein/serine/threonine protein kinase
MGAPQVTDAALESLVGQIADDFTRRYQRGENPSADEYVQRHPELANVLREILPAIVALSPSRDAANVETPRGGGTLGGGAISPPPASIGDFEILGEIGRGGMGVVYKARHRALGRIVALKMLRSGDPVDVERFRREAQAVAHLQHPNVVQIFEVREVGGQPLLALEYVAGGTLADRIKGEPQPPREAARLIETLARAVAAAHKCGLVHRDLKPSNVLLVSGGVVNGELPAPPTSHHSTLTNYVPKISDFGLAKRLDLDSRQTQTGAILGTPSYMAPEQAVDGTNVGPAADIFALGAILYELISGRPPFKGPSVLETLEMVRHAEPTPPSQLQPGCPRDLETICLKCLHKDSSRRYASAADLADDLQRFLKGESVHARPVGSVERLSKWLRRRPAVAASLALAVVAVLAVVALTVRMLDSWELEAANQKLGNALQAQDAALVEIQAGRRQLDDALERERALHYAHSITLAQREWQANRVDEARRILDACPPELRHWEWRFLHRQCHAELLTICGHIGAITALAASPDGKLIAAASAPLVVGKNERDLKIWDAATGALAMELVGHQGTINGVAFSPDSALLASTSQDKTIRFWDLRNGKELRKIDNTACNKIAFSPDGKRLAVAAAPGIHLFDVASGDELFALAGHFKLTQALAFSADGERLVSGGDDGLIKLWDLKARNEIFSKPGMAGPILSVQFSPKQDQIVSAASEGGVGTVRSKIRILNARTGLPVVRDTLTFPFRINDAVFNAEGTQIVCAADDGSVLFLHAKSGRTLFALRGHAGAVSRLALMPDGKHVVTGSADRTVRVWPAANPEYQEWSIPRPDATALAMSADGSRVAWSDGTLFGAPRREEARLHVVTIPPAEKAVEFEHPKRINSIAFLADNRSVATADEDVARLWAPSMAAARLTIGEPGVVGIAQSPDGQFLATATRNPDVNLRPDISLLSAPIMIGQAPKPQPVPAIKIWRLTDGQLERVLPGQIGVDFSPNGELVAGADDRSVKIWDFATGNEVLSLSGPAEPILKVQFVDGGRKVIGFTHRQAIVWETGTGRTIATLRDLRGPAAATGDGRRIVSLHGGLVKWWDVQLGRELISLSVNEVGFHQLALSADGRYVVAAGQFRLVVWDAPP